MRRALILAGLLAAEPASAACTVSATSMVFGVYNPASPTGADVTSTITVSCTIFSGLGANVIKLTAGLGTFAARRVVKGASAIPYQLYSDAGHQSILGDATGGTVDLPGISLVPLLGGTSTYTVYGHITPGATANPGTYIDSITVTFAY